MLRQTRFANKRLNPIGIELLSLATLRARVPEEKLRVAERVGFFMVLVVTAGHGEHLIDFERFSLRVGDVLFVKPGQVQQWLPQAGLTADLLVIDPAALQPCATIFPEAARALLRLEYWASKFEANPGQMAAWKSLAVLIRQELDQPQLDDLSATMGRELLLCMMLGLSRTAATDVPASNAQTRLVQRFLRELESQLHDRPSLTQIARKLHVSTSTLSRTCARLLGRSAKATIDRRIALEAQRLLVFSTATSVAIGEQLGFLEPTNFVKFFRRQTGMTPGGFRAKHRLPRRSSQT